MTAICAYWSRTGMPVAAARIDLMLGALASYGPHRVHRWSDGAAGLGIAQYQSLPEDRHDVHPTARDGTALVADIRLDNRDVLIRELRLAAHEAACMADSALLHAAWRVWGPACVHHLVGDFAFAVWNPAEQTLFCARDPMGARPLCYATMGHTIAIATAPAGLVALPELPRRLDERRMAEYLALVPSDGSRTFFEGVSALPPGHTLHVTRDRVDTTPYWEPPRAGSLRLRRDDDYVEQFQEIFDRAVGARLRSTTVISASVSGGFDSSSVAARAAHLLHQHGAPLHALTWIPRPGAHAPGHARSQMLDESAHVAALAARWPNMHHHLIDSETQSPLDFLPAYHAAWAQPLLNPIKAPMLLATSQRLAALQCGVVLTGQAGNMTISYDGVTRIPTLLRRGRLVAGMREAAALTRAPGWSKSRVAAAAIAPLVPSLLMRTQRRLRGRPAETEASTYSLIHPDFAATHGLTMPNSGLGLNSQDGVLTNADVQRRQLFQRLDFGQATKGSLAVMGVEQRDPTWDMRVAQFCWSIPEDQFLRKGQTRWLIRRAMDESLPPLILQETRRGVQSGDWPRFLTPYRAEYVAALARLETSPRASAMVNLDVIRRLLDQWPAEWTAKHRLPYGIFLSRVIGAGEFIRDFD